MRSFRRYWCWRARGGPATPYYGWRFAALVVLAITGVAWFFWPDAAGYIGGCAWFFLLFLPAIGLRKMTQLATQGDYKSAGILAQHSRFCIPALSCASKSELFRRLGSNTELRRNFSSVPADHERARSAWRDQLRNTPAVLILILINVLVFLFEMSAGDWNDPEVLHRIGALEPYAVVVQKEYWRLFTALFLHGGFLHSWVQPFRTLCSRTAAGASHRHNAVCRLLLDFGARLQRRRGCFDCMGLVQVAQVIGASGCIMGIVGAWAGFLLRHHHAPLARQRLANIGLIVAIQIAFDLSTPQISMAAHLCGLVAGFFLGLMLAPGDL